MKKDKVQHLRNGPQLRFKNFIDKYELKTIGAIATRITAGGTPATKVSSYWINGEIPWMSSGEVNKRELYGTEKKITKSGLDNSSSKMIKSQSVLMALAGQGKTRGMVAVNEIPLCTNQSIAAIEVDEAELDYKYLFYNLHKDYNKLRRLSSTGEGRGGINLKFISRWKLNIPSLDEQHKVASFISNLDHKISSLEYKLENLKLFIRGLTDKLIEDNISCSYILGDVGKTVNGLTGKTKEDFGTGESFINYMNVFSNKFIDINECEKVIIMENEKQNSLQYGDIVFTTSSETPNEVGMTSVFMDTSDLEIYLNSFCFIFRLNNFDLIDPRFAGYYFRSSLFRSKMYKLAQGISRYNLSKGNLLKEQIKIPIIEKQVELSKIFNSYDKKIEFTQEKLKALKQFKKGLLQQMFI